jgi:4-amino-4-deoxy-L-arabinose transferase-like glycosyltransferase
MMGEHLPTWTEAFKHDPLPHLGAFALGALALVLAIAAHVVKNDRPQPKLGLGFGAVGAALLALACGIGGWLSQTAQWKAVITVAGLSAADIARLQRSGEQEASWHLISGACAASLPFALGLFAIFIARARPRPNRPDPGSPPAAPPPA